MSSSRHLPADQPVSESGRKHPWIHGPRRRARILRLCLVSCNGIGVQPPKLHGLELCRPGRVPGAVEPLLRASATLEMVTTVPVANVTDIVVAHVV